MQIASALVWPALALVFAGAFAGLWFVDRLRRHLLGFGVGFFALFLAMTVIIAFPSLTNPYVLVPMHALACISVTAIVWGAVNRLNQRTPLVAMGAVSLISCFLLFIALRDSEHPVALIVQNEASGLLFAIGAVSLWAARSTNLLDRILVWTMSLIAGFSLLRPIALLYLHIDMVPLVERKIELSAINVVVLTVLTAVLGLVLVAIAIQEALEIRHGAERADPISGFLDQRTFDQMCEPALATAQRLNIPVSLAVLQFDWFEKVLEKWGSATSDMVVREVSDIIRAWQRESDVIGRIGEDRFGILFVGVGSNSAQQIVCKLRREVDDACNEKMSGLLRFTLSSSISEASSQMSFSVLMRNTLTPLAVAEKLGANISFVDGVELQSSAFAPLEDGTFVTHG